jgi:hypothetical protein
MATTVAGTVAYLESDGKAINVDLLYAVNKGAVTYAQGILGIACASGASGGTIALAADDREYRVKVPSGLTITKGMILYITVATTTGHYPDDEAYTTSAGAGKWAFLKCTVDKDAGNVVTGVLLAHNSLLS